MLRDGSVHAHAQGWILPTLQKVPSPNSSSSTLGFAHLLPSAMSVPHSPAQAVFLEGLGHELTSLWSIKLHNEFIESS